MPDLERVAARGDLQSEALPSLPRGTPVGRRLQRRGCLRSDEGQPAVLRNLDEVRQVVVQPGVQPLDALVERGDGALELARPSEARCRYDVRARARVSGQRGGEGLHVGEDVGGVHSLAHVTLLQEQRLVGDLLPGGGNRLGLPAGVCLHRPQLHPVVVIPDLSVVLCAARVAEVHPDPIGPRRDLHAVVVPGLLLVEAVPGDGDHPLRHLQPHLPDLTPADRRRRRLGLPALDDHRHSARRPAHDHRDHLVGEELDGTLAHPRVPGGGVVGCPDLEGLEVATLQPPDIWLVAQYKPGK